MTIYKNSYLCQFYGYIYSDLQGEKILNEDNENYIKAKKKTI